MLKPIETLYNKVTLRSRLEARWAVFFDQLGVEWQYEPEGFALANGVKYVPDFFLANVRLRGSQVGVYVEIKGTTGDAHHTEHKHRAFGACANLVVFVGEPPGGHQASDMGYTVDPANDSGYEYTPRGWDNCMMWFVCPSCGAIKIEFSEGNYMRCPETPCPQTRRNHQSPDEIVRSAVEVARAHRFDWSAA